MITRVLSCRVSGLVSCVLLVWSVFLVTPQVTEAQSSGPVKAITWHEPPAEANNLTRFVGFGTFPTEQDGRDAAQKLLQKPEGLRALFTQNFSRYIIGGAWSANGPNPHDFSIATALTETIDSESRTSIEVEPLPYDLENGHTIRIQAADPSVVPGSRSDIIVAYVDGGATEGATAIPITGTRFTSGDPVSITAANGDRVLSKWMSIWPYHSVAEVKASMEDFAFGIYDEGAVVDWMILDTEANYSANTGVKYDPRWDDPAHGVDGQSFKDILSPYTIDEVISSGGNNNPSLKWMAEVSGRAVVDGLNEAFFEPLKSYFPEIRGSDYERTGLSKAEAETWAPQRDAWQQYKPHIFGTHGAKPLYASIRLLSNESQRGVVSLPHEYGRAPFSVIRWQVNFKRAMHRDTNGKSQPWLTYPNLSDSFFFRVDPKNSPYWDEHNYHMALSTDSAPLLYWNARDGGGGGADDVQDMEIDNILDDINNQLGGNDFTLLSTGPIEWDHNIVATAVSAGGQVHYRITVPRLDWEDMREVTVDVSNGDTITIPGGEVGAWYTSSDPNLTFAYEHLPVDNLFPSEDFLGLASENWNIVSGGDNISITSAHVDPFGTNKALRLNYQTNGVNIESPSFIVPPRNQFGNERDRWYTLSFWTKRTNSNYSFYIYTPDFTNRLARITVNSGVTDGQWHRVRAEFRMPTNETEIALRLDGAFSTYYLAFPMLHDGWGAMPPYVAPGELTETSQTISLDEGWNLVGSHVIPDQGVLEEVLGEAADSITLVKDVNGNLFFPELGLNDIGSWDEGQAYYILAHTPASFTITGEPVDPAMQVAVEPGWNLVPYHGTVAVPMAEAFSSGGEAVVMARETGEAIYYPADAVTTLSHAEPGRGYLVYVTESGALTMTGSP